MYRYGNYNSYYSSSTRRTSSRSTTARQSTPATEKQISFIGTLRDGRELEASDVEMVNRLLSQEVVSMAAASNAIEFLKAKPWKREEVANPVTEAGMYKLDTAFFKVQLSKQSGRFYAKRLVRDDGPNSFHFEYEARAIHQLRADHRLTLEEAKAWGVANCTCIVCGTLLTDPKSVAAGIGPVCAKRV